MSALAKKSTKDEWNEQGKAFFEKQKYDLVKIVSEYPLFCNEPS